MELHQYFAKRTWWGKFIGAFFGFLIAGPIGAFLGLLVGNFFDRGLAEHFSKPFWYYHAEKNQQVQRVFFESLFSMLGYLAKTEGRVSEASIQNANEIMLQMGLDTAQKKAAQHFFNAGKAKGFNLYSMLNVLQQQISNKPTLVRLFVETQYQSIRRTGLTAKKLEIMNNLLATMRLAPLQQQHHFADEFSWYSTLHNAYQQQQQSSYQHQYQQQQQQPHHYYSNEDAYTVLGITSSASQSEVKRAYRRQISTNHPDKLIAKKASEREIKQANEKTQRIRKAYEIICEARGW